MIFSECDAESYSPEGAGYALKPVAMPKNLSEILMAQILWNLNLSEVKP
jgi:hypothetical protein